MISQREVARFIEQIEGLRLIGIETKRHYHVRVRTPNDKEHIFVLAKTPSDHRAELNNRAFLKRLVRTNLQES